MSPGFPAARPVNDVTSAHHFALSRRPHQARKGHHVRAVRFAVHARPVLLALLIGRSVATSAAQEPTPPPPSTQATTPRRPTPAPSIGPFLGGVPSGQPVTGTLSLSIADALNRALEHNLGLLLTNDGMDRARGARFRALSELLPNVSARMSGTRQQLNLAAYGFPLPAGIPSIVGPFNIFDARLYVSQSVLDFKALNDARAEEHNVAAAQFEYKSARDLVVLVAVDAYAQALSASARVDAARTQVDTAQALYNQAVDLKQGGLVAGIEVLRAEVQLATDQQRITAAQTAFEKAKLQLAHLVGLPIGQPFTLTDPVFTPPIPEMTLEQAVERAYKTRGDYQAALERVRAAEATREAARGERLPVVRVTANYGELGTSTHDAHSTFAVGGAVDVPIFQGGKTRGRLLEADADLRSRRADADDLKASIYYEVRAAMLDLQAGTEQMQVAARARELAAMQLTQARDRFAAGVAGNIEVVQAQSVVALANDQYIAAVYATNVAKGALVHSVGIAEETARQIFGGF
jgi:outer membrane protein TolC